MGGQVRTAWLRPCLDHGPRPTPRGRQHLGRSQCQGAPGGHSAYLVGVAEHVALGAGDAELQQPLLLLQKPTRCHVPAQVRQSPEPQPGQCGPPPRGNHWLRLSRGPQHHQPRRMQSRRGVAAASQTTDGGMGLGEGKGLARGHRAPGVGAQITPQACLPSWVCTGGSVQAGWVDHPPQAPEEPPEPPRCPDAPAPEGPPKA